MAINSVQIPAIRNGDPSLHYRWVRNKPERYEQLFIPHGDRPGYSIVQGTSIESTRELAIKLFGTESAQGLVDERNRIKYGDLILASIPKVEYEQRLEELRENDRRTRQSIDEAYRDSLDRRGVRALVAELGEFEDRKSFATRESNNRVGYTGKPRTVRT
jgi:hypothetical protein